MIERTATAIAPWHVIPTDGKKFARSEALELIAAAPAKDVDLRPQPLAEEARALAPALFGSLPKDVW